VSNLPSRTRVGAFFDLDGTLIPFPSLERRLFGALLYRHAISARNSAYWAIEALRLASQGAAFVKQANKMYLRGVSVEATSAVAERIANAPHLRFFPQAVDQAAWHAIAGHRIVLVSGTLQLLALYAARALQAELAGRAITATIVVGATRLEAMRGHWTGRLAGAAMFGQAKANAIQALAAQMELDLGLCFAYGDSVHDEQMLDHVGHPVTVNASKALRRIAARKGWQAVEWRLPERSGAPREKAPARMTENKAETLG
jgi:HAD superfamily hydrolase (TIGR01490 family)